MNRVELNSRQRVLHALRCLIPDRVPIFEMWINEVSVMRLACLLGIEAYTKASSNDIGGEEPISSVDMYCSVVEALNLDATCYKFSMGLKTINKKVGKDKYGTIYRLSEHGSPIPIKGPINRLRDLIGFEMVSRLDHKDFSNLNHIIKRFGKEKMHFAIVSDPFKVSWHLRGGMEALLTDFILDPELVYGLARITTDFCKAAIEIAANIGVETIVLNGDLAGEVHSFISRDHYLKYIKPYQKEIVEHAHSLNLLIIKHSDGNLWSILDDLIEVGFDGLHPIQPQCMDIFKVKEYVEGRMCLIGNIDCRNLLPFGTEDKVEKAVEELLAKMSPGGCFIISSSNSIHPDCKPENYISMVSATHRYGK